MLWARQPGCEKTEIAMQIPWLLCFLLIALSSCSAPKPNLHQAYFPESYQVEKNNPHLDNSAPQFFSILHLNNDYQLNKQVVQFWYSEGFPSLFAKEHPVLRFSRNDIITLGDSLNLLFDIYYFASDMKVSDAASKLIDFLQHKKDCTPLSNYEIQFMMNNTIENAFPRVPFTMLIISSFELLTQKEGTPVYPKVHSEYLRKYLDLPPLKPIAGANLFATKMGDSVYLEKTHGFIFCRKKRN